MTIYPVSVLRTVAFHTQSLSGAQGARPCREDILQMVDRVGCVQIDTLHLVRRSHYLAATELVIEHYEPAALARKILQFL